MVIPPVRVLRFSLVVSTYAWIKISVNANTIVKSIQMSSILM